ncbi:hypothetical protein PCANC_13772 [Puccinia coronata f. sp. avenae]|uniref:Fungal lipase-type domain-containing protein n=1 Tax=Puccinia coronata f. sp. avenae TaxID=200324 RepID=A0A2N5VAJ4_9BASI|nr:hypothetical protein PCANC_13772 [Puccinia coronata f. sp. avenae]PLW47013.1 hypothetical protein PCASD_03920 [Puccinia coronata f. sp. avenae]
MLSAELSRTLTGISSFPLSSFLSFQQQANMNFSRIQALLLAISLLGLSRAHSIRPRALAPSDPDPALTSRSNRTNSDPRPKTQTVNNNNNNNNQNSTVALSNANSDPPFRPDHPDWDYLNGYTWWKSDPTQQDHARFHAYLSMASYGDYANLCPKTFTKGFTVLQTFSTRAGQNGFIALIPEMVKVVIVFQGVENLQSIDWRPASIEDLVADCQGCAMASGVRQLYLSAKQATNNWDVAIRKVAETGLKFSVTGLGVGGAVAALAAMDLGSKGLVHYAHNQGMPRAMNYAAMVRYDNLFQVLAGQSVVSENDWMVQAIPMRPFYHVGSKVKILGPMQQWLINCYGNNENRTCTGDGSSYENHSVYFTPKGECGKADKGW